MHSSSYSSFSVLQLRDLSENPGSSIGKCGPVLASQNTATEQDITIGAPRV